MASCVAVVGVRVSIELFMTTTNQWLLGSCVKLSLTVLVVLKDSIRN